MVVRQLSGGFLFSLIRLSHISAVNPSSNIRPPFTVAVCGTQTRTSRACSQIGHKARPGNVLPLTTGRVARKCLTKPLDLELVEHVDSFECGTATEWWIYILLNQTKPHKCGQSQQQYVVPHSKLFPSKAVSDR